MEIRRGSRIVLIRDMNGRVGNSEVAGVVGKWGVDGVNENGGYLVDMCAERGLFLANTFFQQKITYKEKKSIINYEAVDEKLRKDVLNAKAVKGMYEWLDHYVVLVKIKIKYR